MIKLAVFDMDGTICDTIEDLAAASDYALDKMGLPLHTIGEYKSFVGNGIPKLIECFLPKERRTDEDKEIAKKHFFDFYSVHFADKTRAYDGIIDLLKALKDRGIHLAVCTNKAQAMAETVAKTLFGGLFEVVIGEGDRYPLKPDPAAVKAIMEKYSATADQTVFIGDSGVDVMTGLNAGVNTIGCTWGFRTAEELKENGAELLARTPSDIMQIINSIN